MNLDAALDTFVGESRELLGEMEDALLAVQAGDAAADAERVNAIFRAAHTIKGSAGLFGLDDLVAFTHRVESVLDRWRGGTLAVDDERLTLLLRCRDHIAALVDAVAAGAGTADAALQAQGAPLLADLAACLAAPPPAPAEAEAEGAGDVWHIAVRFGPDVLRNGMDPLAFIRYLGTLGEVVGVLTLDDALPKLDALDPETCHLGFQIACRTHADKATLEAAFEFVRDDCTLSILPPHSRADDYLKLLDARDAAVARLGEMLVRCGTVTARELDAALAAQASAPERSLGSILVAQGAVQPQVVDAALARQTQVKQVALQPAGPPVQDTRSVRVDADKLDRLIDLVGELIIAGARVDGVARRLHDTELQESTSRMAGLVADVRDSALQLRMVKIGATFKRYVRVVHDVSRELGKDIALSISGEDTELDKTVVEKIGDPLMHLVRNAIDHGIESAAERAARGKPAQGTLRLSACHDSGSIVIRVEDDGGGLDRARILAKAVERGLVESGQALDDDAAYALIFEPGFSTAAQVTNLSGRGVGLDVVKRNITALRGSVAVASRPGAGTTVTIRLPLTLAIIDGFLVGVDGQTFALPLDAVEECIPFAAATGHDYTELRGAVLPFVRLRRLFGIAGQPRRGENIVVLQHAGRQAGLVVDTLLGEFQTVIKPLGPLFAQVPCLAGSTILGNGEVALILDVPALVRQAGAAKAAERAAVAA